jgi:cysteinyl-tRNA synthetase
MSPEADGRAARPVDLLADAKRYRKRAQTAENELEKLKNEIAAREKTVADLTQAVSQQRTVRSLESQLRSAGAIDLDAALALAERALAAKSSVAEGDVVEAVAELQRMRPWLFRSAAARKAASETGVMSVARNGDSTSFRTSKIEHAAGEAIATGARTDLLRYLRLRRSRKK